MSELTDERLDEIERDAEMHIEKGQFSIPLATPEEQQAMVRELRKLRGNMAFCMSVHGDLGAEG